MLLRPGNGLKLMGGIAQQQHLITRTLARVRPGSPSKTSPTLVMASNPWASPGAMGLWGSGFLQACSSPVSLFPTGLAGLWIAAEGLCWPGVTYLGSGSQDRSSENLEILGCLTSGKAAVNWQEIFGGPSTRARFSCIDECLDASPGTAVGIPGWPSISLFLCIECLDVQPGMVNFCLVKICGQQSIT